MPKPSAGCSRAERNIRWIETHCRIPEGKDVGKPVRLREWQKDILRKIYDNAAGTRMAIISLAKKNAKTSLSGMLLLLHLAGPESIANTQLPSTAQSREQAAVLYNLAAKMVRMSPTLSQYVTPRDSAKQLFCAERGTLYKALSADAATAHGGSPVFAVHDELGQVRGPVSELFNAVENAMGAHEAPMSIVISTQAPTDADLLSILIDDAKTGRDERIVLALYTADMDLDPFSEEAIRQANPAFGDFLNATEILDQAEKAKALPSQESLYRNYTLNQRVEANDPYMPRGVWERNSAEPNADFSGRPVYGGLDLSENADLTSLVLIAPDAAGLWDVVPTFWLPGEGIHERSRKDRVPYAEWAKAGVLEAIEGERTVDYDFVARRLRAICDRWNVVKIAFDRYNFRHLKPCLIRAGFTEEKSRLSSSNSARASSACRRPFDRWRLWRSTANSDMAITLCLPCALPTPSPRRMMPATGN
jgi:phage terminase large subunit-like protein